MGYEILRSLSFNLDKLEANLSVASSNVTPKIFYKEKLSGILPDYKRLEDLEDVEKFLYPIIIEVRTGVFKLRSSVSSKIRYAFYKTLEEIYELENKHNIDIWNIRPVENKLTKFESKIIKEVVEYFLYYYHSENKIIRKKIVDEKGCFVKKINRRSIEIVFRKNEGKLYENEKDLYLDMRKLQNYNKSFNIVNL
ncbi:hypothetical protein [Staphylococcus shinii]|uniref:hypothetical protein n=1 Tax=Staphylococcus shinii TaxID=2912228 RepID=UPI003F557882